MLFSCEDKNITKIKRKKLTKLYFGFKPNMKTIKKEINTILFYFPFFSKELFKHFRQSSVANIKTEIM